MKTILCPTDFSGNATCAVNYGASIANELNAKLILLNVFETPLIYTEAQIMVAETVEKQTREDADKKLKLFKSELMKKYPQLSVETTVEEGLSFDKIVQAANNPEAEFIVMGTTGKTRLERMVMGNTAVKVIRHTNCPVLCIPDKVTFKGVKKIVFATDLKEDNIVSARQICFLAKHFNAEIVFLFVDNKELIHSEEDVQEMIKKIRGHITYPRISGYISKHVNITKGIELFLEQYPADWLVMLSHEKHLPKTLFYRCITKIMSYQTAVPLLTLKVSTKTILKEVI